LGPRIELAAFEKIAHNRLAGRGQVRRISHSFSAASGGVCALKQASAALLASFHDDRAIAFSHAVNRTRAVVKRERIQRPIGIRDHTNRALAADKNGHIGAGFAPPRCGFRRVQDLLRMLGKTAHAVLIGAGFDY
jgi:hypothetical protein